MNFSHMGQSTRSIVSSLFALVVACACADSTSSCSPPKELQTAELGAALLQLSGTARHAGKHAIREPSQSVSTEAAHGAEEVELNELGGELTNGDDGEDIANAEDADAPQGADSHADSRDIRASLLQRDSFLTLDEHGYRSVVASRSNRAMRKFVEHLAEDMSLSIVDPGGLSGMVPYYSGQRSTQSFRALRSELLSTARMKDGWLESIGSDAEPISITQGNSHRSKSMPAFARPKKTKTLKKTKPKKRDPVSSLLQTGVVEHHSHQASSSTSMLSAATSSLLSVATKVAQAVPDIAVALLGSTTVVLMCALGCVGYLFYLDVRKRVDQRPEPEYQWLNRLKPPSEK
jgi:hypothetical protein